MPDIPVIKSRIPYFFILLSSLLFLRCTSEKNPLFRLVPGSQSGIDIQNDIGFTDSLNILNYMYFFNGAGVAAGDINNDGLEDLFFTANQQSNRLYLNLGNFQFKDITQSAGLESEGWSSGVSMVDLNADGLLDIYICRTAYPRGAQRANLLYINQGNLKFSEEAVKYGIADTSYSTQAAFFDYDRDGDLDLYLLNHAHQFSGTNDALPKKLKGQHANTDKLYRNDSNTQDQFPYFRDVSKEAGILIEGFGLGVAISDLNQDGWPDIYVSNDFISNDLLYLNKQDGSFSNQIAQVLTHQSHNGMGNDIADVNNDGLSDIFVADMLPEVRERQSQMMTNTTFNVFSAMMFSGYEAQYTRNTLQLNRSSEDMVFSEIAQLAGLDATDWSWSPLWVDLDLDGMKDLIVSNGYVKDLTDLDAIAYRKQRSVFTTKTERDSLYLRVVNELPGIRLPNYVYQNKGNLNFSDKSSTWGFTHASYSHGAAYSDLDNDGDLDLVIHNTNAPPFLYENGIRDIDKKENPASPNFLSLQLQGPQKNLAGYGAKIYVYLNDQQQYFEQSPYRGYQSSVSPRIQVGLGSHTQVDSLKIVWPDGKIQQLQRLEANQFLTLEYSNSSEPILLQKTQKELLWLEKTEELGLDFISEEFPYIDVKVEPLLPHDYSSRGPAIAVGDINGDGSEDFILGGSAGKFAQIFLQTPTGKFDQDAFALDAAYEDIGLVLFDVEMDGDLDLYAVSGGNEYWAKPEMFQDRLYLNDGKGNFRRDSDALPQIQASGSGVNAADFDKDGDLDLFVAGRVVPGKYAASPSSYLLRNTGGKFADISEEMDLSQIGMVSSALWTDYDNDSWLDLLLVGEWMPVTLFKNENGTLRPASIPAFDQTYGWWNSINGGDFDNDGDTDYVLGNTGLNTRLRPSIEEPLQVYAGYLDNNGSWDALLSHIQLGADGERHAYPIYPRDQLLIQMKSLAPRFPDYASYSHTPMHALFTKEMLDNARILQAQTFATSFLENKNGESFAIKALPVEAQFSSTNGIQVLDLDDDNYLDLLLTGNFYGPEVSLGRQDASYGLSLKGNGQGEFSAIPYATSGMRAAGDTRALAAIRVKDQMIYLLAQQGGPLRAWTRARQTAEFYTFKPQETSFEIAYKDGSRRKVEAYIGSGYLSQSSKSFVLPE